MKQLFTFLLLSYCLAARSQLSVDLSVPDSNLVFKTDSLQGVIFGKNFKTRLIRNGSKSTEIDLIKVISNGQGETRFIPDIETILTTEPKLKTYIRNFDSFIADSLHCYTKQYLGYTTQNKDTIIYINCFFDQSIHELGFWRESIVTVFDGWHHFFKVKYNLRSKEFFDLRINGWG